MNINYEYDFHKHHELELPKEAFSNKGLSGLINLGNKCFMNSIIACLSNTLKLTDYFLSKKYSEDDPQHSNKNKPEYFLVMSYVNLLINIWETNQLLKPKSFVENMSKFIKKYFNLHQQDSHECLMYILDILHKGLSYEIDVEIKGEEKTKHDTLVKESLVTWKSFYEKSYSYLVDIFNGMFHNTITCNNCKTEENVFDPFNCISVNVPVDKQTTNIDECLSNYFDENENIPSWKCEKCNESGCNKSSKLWTLPNYLIIHLKRFTNDGKKINTQVDFPLDDLNLTKFMSKDKEDPNNYIYSLYAINYHSGTVDSGHYWSCCKNLNNNWYIFNDGNISKFQSENDILTRNAYILFYHRKMIPIKN